MKNLLTSLIEKINATLQPIKRVLSFNASGKGMAIGKISEKDGLEVDWNAYFYGPVTFAKKITKQYLDLTFSASGKRFGCIPEIGVDGVMEVGKYIDFHETNADTSDYSVRITSSSNGIDIGKGLSIGGTKVVDFVVEQGVSSGWTYRKWNSGIAECWGRLTETKTNYTTFNGFYGYYGYMYFPEGLFNEPPITQYCGIAGSGFTMPALGGRKDSKDFFVYYFLSTQGGTTSVGVEAYSIGRWK